MNNFHYKKLAIKGLSRRSFVKGTSMAMVFTPMLSAELLAQSSKKGTNSATVPSLLSNSVGFQGMRLDPLSKLYFAGNGTRAYSPSLMRFVSQDSVAYSPFGEGGPHSYAFVNGNPINYRDPTGHFAFIPILVGAVVGAVVGATIAAVAEGIQTAVSGDSFDWSQVAVGAALGFISGGFGAAAKGASTSVKVGLAVADSVASGGVDFIHGVSSGQGTKQAAIGASIGAVVGLATSGIGAGISRDKSGSNSVNEFEAITFGKKRNKNTEPRYIALGRGKTYSVKSSGDLDYFIDTPKHKPAPRLNIVAHGSNSGKLLINEKNLGPSDVMLKIFQVPDIGSIQSIRLVSCHAGNSGFASDLGKLTGMPIKAYSGELLAWAKLRGWGGLPSSSGRISAVNIPKRVVNYKNRWANIQPNRWKWY